MIDERTKDMMDLFDIKQELVKVMLNKYTSRNMSKEELARFSKYSNLQLKNNKSKNNLDSRINGIYNVIKGQYDNYVELNNVYANLD